MQTYNQRLICSTVTVLGVVIIGGFVVVGGIGEHTVTGLSFLKFAPKKRYFVGMIGTNSTLQTLATSVFLFDASEVIAIRSAFYREIIKKVK